MRIVELLVAANAVCGIAAFFLARGVWNRVKRPLEKDSRKRGSA